MLDRYVTWIKTHERLLLVIVVSIVIYTIYSKYTSHEIEKLTLKKGADDQALVQAKAAQAQAEINAQAAQARSDQATAQAAHTIQLLETAIQQRDSALTSRQKSEASMTSSDLAGRWALLEGLPQADFKSDPSGGLIASRTAVVKTVQDLEQVPVLTADLADRTKERDQRDGQIKVLNELVTAYKNDIAADKVTLAKQQEDCKTDKELAVAKAKKHNWFVTGLLTIGGVVLGRTL